MAAPYIDLHTHSSASDGSDTPAELAIKAKEAKLTAFALTDHDTLSGVKKAQKTAQVLGIECIAGCEIAVQDLPGELHMLGLWVPLDDQEFVRELRVEKQKRLERNSAIIELLNKLGMEVSLEEVLALASGPTVGRPHIARTLVGKGYVANRREAFERYLGVNGRAFIPREVRSPEAGIGALVKAGATVVWAHPFFGTGVTVDTVEGRLKEFMGYGLAAIEAFHSSHSAEQVRACLNLAKKYNLLVSGGSDYHGAGKPMVELGYCNGRQRMAGSLLDTMKQVRQEQGLPV